MSYRPALRLQLDLWTPAYLGGAQARVLDPYMPLRPSSVRGLLRSWFRVAAGALLWPADASRDAQGRAVEALLQAESALFGNTERASPIVVLPPKVSGMPYGSQPWVAKPAEYPGLRYLGYGLFEDKDRAPEALTTSPAQPLDLEIGSRREIAGLEELLEATAWLWLMFGGIGARSRRGFGALGVRGVPSSMWPAEMWAIPDTHQALVKRLLDGLDRVTDVFREHLPKLTTSPLQKGQGPLRELRTIDGVGTVTVLPVDASTGVEALERAGRLFRNFRSTLQRRTLGMPPLPDYFSVKAAIQSRRAPTGVERAAFGLPLPFYFRSLGGAKTRFDVEGGDRLASPLLFRVHAIGDGAARRYVVTLVNLAETNGALPLLGQRLIARDTQIPFAAPDGKIITQFISWALAEAQKAPYAPGRRTP